MAKQDYYSILGVDKNATASEIKKLLVEILSKQTQISEELRDDFDALFRRVRELEAREEKSNLDDKEDRDLELEERRRESEFQHRENMARLEDRKTFTNSSRLVNWVTIGSLSIASGIGGLHLENYADLIPGEPSSWVQEFGASPLAKDCEQQIASTSEALGNTWIRELSQLDENPHTITSFHQVRVADRLSYWVCITNRLTGEAFVYEQPDAPQT